MQAKISVVMPVYNTKKFLEEAVKSILNQDFRDFEFIILDDFSSDGSFEILQDFAKKDERIRLFRNEKNEWISFCRNKLISLSKTNIICPQDSDDISEKNRLSLIYNFFEQNFDFAVVWGNCTIIDEDSKIIWFRKYSQNVEKIILKKSPVSNWSVWFKKDVFYEVWGYDDTLNYAEDYDLWLKIFSKWYKIWVLEKFLYFHRIRTWQTKSSKLKETLKNTLFVQNKARKIYKIKATFSDILYNFLLKILYILPSSFVLFLFKILEYKNDKR